MTDYQPSPTWVPINKIQPGFYHGVHEFRRTVDKLDDLAADIDKRGIVDPIITNSALELAAGTRRLAAAKQLGLTQVPVIARDNEEFIHALLHDATHPSTPALKQALNLEEKLKLGLLIQRLSQAYLWELRSLRISREQNKRRGNTYKGPDIPDLNFNSLYPIFEITEGRWSTLRFLGGAVGANPPVSPRVPFEHNTERAKYWLAFAMKTGMLDKAQNEYANECRPEGWVEPPRKRTHPSDAPVTVTAERYLRTAERSAAVLTSTLSALDDLGGVPTKLTYDQLTQLAREYNTVARQAQTLRTRINAALNAAEFVISEGVSQS